MTRRPWITLLAGALLTGSLGSIHAFSVFIEPLEEGFGVTRAQASAVYSLALLSLTAAVFLGHRLYGRLPPPGIAGLAAALAALGLGVSAEAEHFTGLCLGYSLLFGGANGIGYGFALQLVAQAMPARRGFAMGAVTAVYALGASGFAWLFGRLAGSEGVAPALLFMAVLMAGVGVVAPALLLWSRAAYRGASATGAGSPARRKLVILLWAGYGSGCAAGLMAIAHAAGIAIAAGARGYAVAGVMLVGLGNAAGGVSAGWLADRVALRRLLGGLSGLSAFALLVLAAGPGAATTLLGLGVVGLAYGAIIAVFPAAVSRYFGPLEAARTYGRVFTAWGLAGLAAPWAAGHLYDLYDSYRPALVAAAFAAFLSAGVVLALPDPKRR